MAYKKSKKHAFMLDGYFYPNILDSSKFQVVTAPIEKRILDIYYDTAVSLIKYNKPNYKGFSRIFCYSFFSKMDNSSGKQFLSRNKPYLRITFK